MSTEPGLDTGGGEAIANLLFGTHRHRVLSLLLLRPGEAFHVRRIARLTGVSAGSLHRELRQLAEAGLLKRAASGNQVLYSANPDSPVFHELSSILDKTAGAPPTLHSPLAAYAPDPDRVLPEISRKALAAVCRRYKVRKMSLFGSAARGEMRPDSDVDLLVEFKPMEGPSLWGLVDMQDELSPLFGNRRVEIASPEILTNPHRRRTIERDLKVLYESR
ncbi:MAG: nucleotidyltransferase domain-containing protein [Betaproteobacteria bacterium]